MRGAGPEKDLHQPRDSALPLDDVRVRRDVGLCRDLPLRLPQGGHDRINKCEQKIKTILVLFIYLSISLLPIHLTINLSISLSFYLSITAALAELGKNYKFLW